VKCAAQGLAPRESQVAIHYKVSRESTALLAFSAWLRHAVVWFNFLFKLGNSYL